MENDQPQPEQKQMTEEEMKAAVELHKKAWEEFNKTLQDNSEEPVTKAELSKAIDFISQDLGGVAQMTQMIGQNMNVLHQNVQQVIQVIQGGQPAIPGTKTKSGIILP